MFIAIQPIKKHAPSHPPVFTFGVVLGKRSHLNLMRVAHISSHSLTFSKENEVGLSDRNATLFRTHIR